MGETNCLPRAAVSGRAGRGQTKNSPVWNRIPHMPGRPPAKLAANFSLCGTSRAQTSPAIHPSGSKNATAKALKRGCSPVPRAPLPLQKPAWHGCSTPGTPSVVFGAGALFYFPSNCQDPCRVLGCPSIWSRVCHGSPVSDDRLLHDGLVHHSSNTGLDSEQGQAQRGPEIRTLRPVNWTIRFMLPTSVNVDVVDETRQAPF